MKRVTEHDQVTVLYEGQLENGEVFESSEDTGPLTFRLGNGSVLPAFETAVLDMAVQETKTVTVPPEEAYGPRNEELVLAVAHQTFGAREIAPGMVVGMNMEKDGRQHKMPATVLKVNGDEVIVDFNHPLAGQEITYTITLHAIDPSTQEAGG